MRSSNTFSITFFVKKYRTSDGKAPIYVRITVDSKRIDLSIKRKVAIDRWDEGRGLAKGNRQDVKTLNAYLEQIRNQLYECQQQLEKERKLITAESIKNRYLGTMKHVERLRKMVNLAVKEEWLMKDPFIKFKLKFEKKERGFLTHEELRRIEEKAFRIDRLDQTRDIFIFNCYTGLSYAEVYDLTSDHIVTGLDGKLWIQGQRRKSKEWFKVPLLPQAKVIIDKYQNHPLVQANGKVLPVYTNQKTNEPVQ